MPYNIMRIESIYKLIDEMEEAYRREYRESELAARAVGRAVKDVYEGTVQNVNEALIRIRKAKENMLINYRAEQRRAEEAMRRNRARGFA